MRSRFSRENSSRRKSSSRKNSRKSRRDGKNLVGARYADMSGKTVILLDSTPTRKRGSRRTYETTSPSQSESESSHKNTESDSRDSDFEGSSTEGSSDSDDIDLSEADLFSNKKGESHSDVGEKDGDTPNVGLRQDGKKARGKHGAGSGSKRQRKKARTDKGSHARSSSLEMEPYQHAGVLKPTKPVWLSSDSEEERLLQEEESPFVVNQKRFDRVPVVPSDTFYRSNLQTTVKELRELDLSIEQLEYIKYTPFFFLVQSILSEDGDRLMERTKKFEGDIRSIIKRFDPIRRCFRMGNEMLKFSKLDVILLFGLRDGLTDIDVGPNLNVRPWMKRCFPVNFGNGKSSGVPRMKKHYVYTVLQEMCKRDPKLVGEDVARLICIYLLTSLFMPLSNTSVSWNICEYVEEFGDICSFDWSYFISNYLEEKLVTTKSMKVAGFAMLLPYMVCEHTDIITPGEGVLFPRFLRWDLKKLHEQLIVIDRDKKWADLKVLPTLKRSEYEKLVFRDIMTYTQGVISPAQHLEQDSQKDSFLGTQEFLSRDLISLGSAKNENETTPDVTGTDNTTDMSSFEETGERSIVVFKLGCSSKRKSLSMDVDVGNSLSNTGSNKDSLILGSEKVTAAGEETTFCKIAETPEFNIPVRKPSVSHGLDSYITPDAVPIARISASDYSSNSGKQDSDTSLTGDAVLCDNVNAFSGLQEHPSELRFGAKTVDVLILENHISELETIVDDKTSRMELLEAEVQQQKQLVIELEEDNIRLGSIVYMQKVEVQVEREHLLGLSRKHYQDVLRLAHKSDKLLIANEANQELLKGKSEEICKLRKDSEAEMNELNELKTNYTIIRQGDELKIAKQIQEIDFLEKNLEHQESEVADLKATIMRLEGANKELENRLYGLTNPTSSQVMSDPDTITIVDLIEKNESLKKEKTVLETNADDLKVLLSLKEDIIKELQYDESDNDDGYDDEGEDDVNQDNTTPEPSKNAAGKEKKNKKANPTGTVARGVKRRTVEDTRKAKQLVDYSQAIILHQGVKKKPADGAALCRWDKDSQPVRKSSQEVREILRVATEEQSDGMVYRGTGPFSYVTAGDLLKVLHNENVTWGVIDCWGELVQKLQISKNKEFPTTILTSHVWEIFDESSDVSGPMIEFIDSQLHKAMKESSMLVVPFNATAVRGDKKPPGGHWVIMKYVILHNNWTFCNPNYPKDGSCDENLKRAVAMKKYLEPRMVHFLDKIGKKTPLNNPKRAAQDKPCVWESCPQLVAGTLDSGVIVCHIIDKILRRHTVGTITTDKGGLYALTSAANYRVRIVKGLCLPDWFVTSG